MIWSWLTGTLGQFVKPVTGVINGWQQRKTAELENDLAISKAQTDAKITRLQTGQNADIAWENLSIQNNGWKDEWFTLLFSIPMILCFIPEMTQYVSAGFEALDKTPEWYRWCLMVAVGSSFGYRKIADFMSLKKGV